MKTKLHDAIKCRLLSETLLVGEFDTILLQLYLYALRFDTVSFHISI